MSAPAPCAVLCAAALVSCTVGPDYRPPEVEVPPVWSAQAASGPAELSAWWTTFGDATLTALVERALAASPDVRAAQARVMEARALRGLAEAERWPSGGVSGSYARQRISENEPVIGTLAPPAGFPFENDVYQASFDASWELDLFGGRRRAREAAVAEVQAFEAEREGVSVSLAAEVARDYVELRALQQRLAITRDNLALQADALAIAQVRYEGGLVNELDVSQAAALRAGTEALIPALEQAERHALHRLAVLAGLPPGALLGELSAALPLPLAPPRVPAGLPSELLRRRPDVRRAERRLAAATARIGVETAELFPSVALSGEVGSRSTESGELTDGASRFFAVGPALDWRLLDFGRIRARIDAQSARQVQALAAYEQAVLIALRDVEDALTACAKEELRHASLSEEVRESGRSVETAGVLYAEGRVTFLAVLDAQRSLHSAQDRRVQSAQAMAANVIALFKALGGGFGPPPPGSAEPGAPRPAPSSP
jgi:outer membrane protein, multidrug efflux system